MTIPADTIDRGDTLASPGPEPKDDTQTPPTDSLDVEGEETPEEKAAREAEEAEAARRQNIRIPKARFDEVVNKGKAREEQLLQEIAALKAQPAKTLEPSVDEGKAAVRALQDKYEELIFANDQAAARVVREQINELQESLIEQRIAQRVGAAQQAVETRSTYAQTVAQLEAQYPVLNPDHAEFQQEQTGKVVELMRAFVAEGAAPADALKKAVGFVFPTPPPAASAPTIAEKRATAARQKAAETLQQQPPLLGGSRSVQDESDPDEVTAETIKKMTPEQLSKARGDFL